MLLPQNLELILKLFKYSQKCGRVWLEKLLFWNSLLTFHVHWREDVKQAKD